MGINDVGDESADDSRAKAMKAAGHLGATSEFLAPKATFFNILYSHPNFGASAWRALLRGALADHCRLPCSRRFWCLTRVGAPFACLSRLAVPPWGEVQHRIKSSDPIALLPNLNSIKGAAVDPALRRQTRVPWGPTGKSSAFPNLHQTQLPSSPLGMHPAPTPALPSVDNLMGKVPYHQSAPESLNPWVRNPPHKANTRQIYERLYGPEHVKPKKAKGVL